jgi:hypothetical protein
MSYGDYFHLIRNVFVIADQPDLYANSLLFWVSRITDNFRVVFGINAIVQLHFMMKTFLLIDKHIVIERRSKISKYLFVLLLLLIPLQTIVGLRYWTAFFVFIYFTLKYLIFNRLRFLWPAVIAPFIHFAFWLPVLVLPLIFLSKKVKGLIYIAIILAYFSSVSLINTLGRVEFESESISSRQDSYLSDGERIARADSTQKVNFYVRWARSAPELITFIGLFLIVSLKRRPKDSLSQDLFSFIMFFLIFKIVFYSQGSMARYGKFFDFYAIVYLIRFYSLNTFLISKPIEKYFILGSIILLTYTSLLRGSLIVMDAQLVYGNLLTILSDPGSSSLSAILFDWLK